MIRALIVSSLFVLALGFTGCSSSGDYDPEILDLPADPARYDPITSYDFMDVPTGNPITAEKASLGRQLYYDYRLSGDGSRSCYHCHLVKYGLTDGMPTAIGAFEKPLTRSSPTMWNIGYHHTWYWDGRANSLEAQAKAAWKGGNMGAKDTESVLAAINAIPGYARQFDDVFGEPANEENVPAALATYMRTIISNDTAWDRAQAGDDRAMSSQQKRGWETFQRIGCTECHKGVLFTDLQYHNVGIGMDAEEPDLGRYKVTKLDQDRGAFKTPTLRDITKSAPYFHNGSVATLREAVKLMAGRGLDNPWLSAKLQELEKYELTDDELDDVLAFLKALEQPPTPAVYEPPVLPRSAD